MLGGRSSSPTLPVIDGLIADSLRNGTRIRMHLRVPDGDARPARVVEGVVLEVATGRDQRTRLRVGIPTGSGDPVEVRVLLDGIERIEAAVDERANESKPAAPSDSKPALPAEPRPSSAQRPAVRRETLAFGAVVRGDSGVRLSREPDPPAERDDWVEPATPETKGR